MDIINDIYWIESDGVNLINDIVQRRRFIEQCIPGYTLEQYIDFVQKNFNPIELRRACCIIRSLWAVWHEKNRRILTEDEIRVIYLMKYHETETYYCPINNLKDLIYEVQPEKRTKMFIKVLSGYIASYMSNINSINKIIENP